MILVLSLIGTASAGLFAGIMLSLVVLMRKRWDSMDQGEFYRDFRGFILIAKGNVTVTILTLCASAFPLVAGVLSLRSSDLSAGVLSLASGAVFFFGCFVVTVAWNVPIYDAVIAWRSEADALVYRKLRDRFHALNLVRLLSSTVSFCVSLISLSLERS